MRSRYIFNFVLLCASVLVAISCSTNEGETTMDEKQSYEADMELTVDDDVWTYISLTTGEIVGTSDFESAEGDESWYARNDWDIAFCNGFIRTNSGTSGSAMGGVLTSSQEYDDVESAPKAGYSVDSIFGGPL